MAQSTEERKRESVIDENLRRVYHETVQEGVPDRFRAVLEALKQQDQSKGPGA